MAIGIVAFAFVAIFGLVPVGLNTFRAAMDTSVRTQLAQRLVFEAQQTDFDKLKDETALRHFDDEGTEVTDVADSIYTTTLQVSTETQLPEAALSRNIYTLIIKVAHNPAHVPDPFAEGSPLQISTHSAYIARTSQ